MRDSKGDDEGDLEEDERQFDPEGNGEDAVFPVVNSKTLVFGADEDGGDDVAGTGRIMLARHGRGIEESSYIKTTNIALCTLEWFFVSKIVRRTNPAAPMTAKMVANTLRIFSVRL